MVVTNTWFKQHKRRRYTWKMPGDIGRYQLDYILVKQRYRNSVKSSRSFPGCDIDSDHNLVMMKAEVQLKRVQAGKRMKKWMLEGVNEKSDAFNKEMTKNIAHDEGVEGETVNDKWKRFSKAVVKSSEVVVGYQVTKNSKKPWMSEMMIRKMDERRKWKCVNTEEGVTNYKRINNELRRETDRAREEWWSKECDELEEFDRRGRSDLLYRKVQQITRTGKSASGCLGINDKSGNLLTEPEQVRKRWHEYTEELYCKDSKPKMEDLAIENENDVDRDSRGPTLIASEIREAIREMKTGKAVGVDGIPAELLKLLADEQLGRLEEICAEMYETGSWPEDFTKVIMIPLPKKQNAVECADHRTISLISHASKILLRVLTKRIEGRTADFIGKTQFGFRRGCGTREAIGVMRMVCERSLDLGNEVFVCFVDFEKAFYRVN